MIIAKIILLVSLITIAYQDFKFRAISWLFLPIVFLMLFYIKYGVGQNTLIKDIAINTLILILIVGCTCIYFVLRRGISLKGFLNTQLGLGDVLLLAAITPYFDSMSFMIFLLVSQFVILLGYIVIYSLTKNKKAIPLAGLLSLFMIVVVLLNILFPNCNLSFYGYSYV